MSKPDLIALQARLLLLEEESVHFARVAEENAKLKQKVARLMFKKERLHAEVERLKAELEEVREKNGSLADRMERADSELWDAWRAEDRLRSILRLLWEEGTDEERCANERAPGCYSHAFSQPCRDAVEAALKEDE